MQIFVVGTAHTAELNDFECYALNRGCDLRWAYLDGALPEVDASTAGIVVFENGDKRAASWLMQMRDRARYLSVPMIAITSANNKLREELLAAGAGSVFDSSAPGETILTEVSRAASAEPLEDIMLTKLLMPFNASTVTTFEEMASLKIRLRAIYQKRNHKIFGDISAVIGLVSETEGAMVISFPQATADQIARRVLMGVADDVSEDMLRDCIGEIANVIAGRARGTLVDAQYKFGISTPTVISGAGHQIRHMPGAPCLVSAFSSDAGEFALQVCLGN